MKNLKLFAFVSSAVLLVTTLTVFGALTNSRAIVSLDQHTVDMLGIPQTSLPAVVGGRYKFGTTATLYDGLLHSSSMVLSPITIPNYDNAVLVDTTQVEFNNDAEFWGLSYIEFSDLAEVVDISTLGANSPDVLFTKVNGGVCVWEESILALPGIPAPEVSLDGTTIKFYFPNGSVFLGPPFTCGVPSQFVVVWDSSPNP